MAHGGLEHQVAASPSSGLAGSYTVGALSTCHRNVASDPSLAERPGSSECTRSLDIVSACHCLARHCRRGDPLEAAATAAAYMVPKRCHASRCRRLAGGSTRGGHNFALCCRVPHCAEALAGGTHRCHAGFRLICNLLAARPSIAREPDSRQRLEAVVAPPGAGCVSGCTHHPRPVASASG